MAQTLCAPSLGGARSKSALTDAESGAPGSTYGARALKRVIQRGLWNPLASLIPGGPVTDGDMVDVPSNSQGLTINGQLAGAA